MLTNTSSGEINFYERGFNQAWKLLGKLSVTNLPDKIEDFPWLQNVTITDLLLTAVNTQRNTIEFYDLKNKKRWQVPIEDKHAVIHKAQALA